MAGRFHQELRNWHGASVDPLRQPAPFVCGSRAGLSQDCRRHWLSAWSEPLLSLSVPLVVQSIPWRDLRNSLFETVVRNPLSLGNLDVFRATDSLRAILISLGWSICKCRFFVTISEEREQCHRMAPQKYAIFYKQNLAGDLLRLWRMRWRMPCLV